MMFRWLSLITLLVSGPGFAADLESQWRDAVEKQQAGQIDTAIALFEAWIAAASSKGVRSPEAHYNLAIAYRSKKDAGRASYHLLESAVLRRSPVRSWTDAQLLSQWETTAGVRDGASSQLGLRFSLAVGKGFRLLLALTAIWLLLGYGVVRYLDLVPEKRRVLRYTAFSAAGALVVLAIAAELNARQWDSLGVVAGGTEGGVVFASSSSDPGGKLAELPSGTLVRIIEEQNDFYHVDIPIAGWIAHERVLRRGEKETDGESAVASTGACHIGS